MRFVIDAKFAHQPNGGVEGVAIALFDGFDSRLDDDLRRQFGVARARPNRFVGAHG